VSATTLFGTEGYARTRIDAVCRAAGVSVGTFYDHFDDKADLMLHVAETAFDGTRPPNVSTFAQLEEQIGALVASPTAGIARAWLEAISAEPALREAHAGMRPAHVESYRRWVIETRTARGVQAPLDEAAAARTVIALLKEGVSATYDPTDERARYLARAIWLVLFGQGSA
jgi:AcrR family transcriptional regulator